MRIPIVKFVASGNDFVLFDSRKHKLKVRLNKFAQLVCDRKFGIGADGLLVLERSRRADVKMRILNADGSEAEMCGNGARCVAYFFAGQKKRGSKQIKIDTKAGLLKAEVRNNNIAINMTKPKSIKLDMSLIISKRTVKTSFINTGVPHVVLLSEGLGAFDVFSLGRIIRFHKRFKPKGTNVNFIEPVASDRIRIRTYERGVEQETLACGTGSVASAIIYFLKLKRAKLIKETKLVNTFVETQSGEVLQVYFNVDKKRINNVWLKGKARIIYKGVFHV